MKNGKTLYLEKRGCDFFAGDSIAELSDVGNYRVTTPDYTVRGKDGNMYFLEFTAGRRMVTRYINKRTGAKLKKPVTSVLLDPALYCSASYTDSNGMTWSNIKLWHMLFDNPVIYSVENILQFVNAISCDNYTAVQFIN